MAVLNEYSSRARSIQQQLLLLRHAIRNAHEKKQAATNSLLADERPPRLMRAKPAASGKQLHSHPFFHTGVSSPGKSSLDCLVELASQSVAVRLFALLGRRQPQWQAQAAG